MNKSTKWKTHLQTERERVRERERKYLLWASAPQTLIWRSYSAVSCSVNSSPSIPSCNLYRNPNSQPRRYELELKVKVERKWQTLDKLGSAAFFEEANNTSSRFSLCSAPVWILIFRFKDYQNGIFLSFFFFSFWFLKMVSGKWILWTIWMGLLL